MGGGAGQGPRGRAGLSPFLSLPWGREPLGWRAPRPPRCSAFRARHAAGVTRQALFLRARVPARADPHGASRAWRGVPKAVGRADGLREASRKRGPQTRTAVMAPSAPPGRGCWPPLRRPPLAEDPPLRSIPRETGGGPWGLPTQRHACSEAGPHLSPGLGPHLVFTQEKARPCGLGKVQMKASESL